MSEHSDRSYEPLNDEDLSLLSDAVITRLKEKRKPTINLVCIGLVQNGAVHYLNSKNGANRQKPGIHDFDFICFFRGQVVETRQQPINAESGLAKFGACCNECTNKRGYKTRKMDIFCRKIEVNESIEASIAAYFKNGEGWVKREATLPCIGVYPADLRGKTLWTGRGAEVPLIGLS